MADFNYYEPGGEKGQSGYAGGHPASAGADLSTPGADEKLAALLSYLLGWVTGLILYFTGKSKYVKFHALQSTITFGAITVFQVAIWLAREALAAFLQPPGSIYLVLNLYGMISAVIWVGSLVLWAFLMSKAYQGESYQLPVAGEIAAKVTN